MWETRAAIRFRLNRGPHRKKIARARRLMLSVGDYAAYSPKTIGRADTSVETRTRPKATGDHVAPSARLHGARRREPLCRPSQQSARAIRLPSGRPTSSMLVATPSNRRAHSPRLFLDLTMLIAGAPRAARADCRWCGDAACRDSDLRLRSHVRGRASISSAVLADGVIEPSHGSNHFKVGVVRMAGLKYR